MANIFERISILRNPCFLAIFSIYSNELRLCASPQIAFKLKSLVHTFQYSVVIAFKGRTSQHCLGFMLVQCLT